MDEFADFEPAEAAPSPPQQVAAQDEFADFEPAQAAPAAAPAAPARDEFADFEPATPPKALTLAQLRDDPETQRDMAAYYTEIDGKPVDPRSAVDRAIHTARRADSNTAQAAFEAIDTRRMSDEQKARFARFRTRFEAAPSFWREGGSGAAGLAENVAYGIADPVNFIGGPMVRGAAALVKGVAPRVAAWLGGTAGRITGTAAIDAAGSAAGNLATQATQNEVGMRDGYSLGEAAVAGAVGAGASGLGNVLGTVVGKRAGSNTTGVPEIDPLLGKSADNPLAPHRETVVGATDKVNARVYDNLTAAAVMQEAGPNGVGRYARDIKNAGLARAGTSAVDPGTLPFVRGRLLAATTERSDQFITVGTFRPAAHNAAAGTAEAGYGRVTGEGLKTILDDLEKLGIPEDHLWLYSDAMRARWLREARNPAEVAKALQKPTGGPAQTFGSYFDDPAPYVAAGYTPAQAQQMAVASVDKVVNHFSQVPAVRDAFVRLQGFFDRSAEYSLDAGVINIDQLARMKGVGIPVPKGVEFAYMPWLPADNGRSAMLTSLASGKAPGGAGSPIRKRLSGNMGNRMPGLERVITYTKRNIAAADRNLFNLSLVDHVMGVQGAGGFGGKMVLRKMDATAAAQALQVAENDAKAALIKQGIANPQADHIDIVAASILAERRGGVQIGGKQSVVAFRNGVQEVYEIVDTELANMFSSMAPEDLGKVNGWMRAISRWRSDLITANPIFMVKDFARNAISATINSQFGAAPFRSAIQGSLILAKGSKLNRNATSRAAGKAFIDEARRSGVGFSNRQAEAMISARGGDVTKYTGLADFANRNFVSRGWQGWKEFGNQIEMTSRLAEYAAARKAGLSGSVAGYLGREVATDFAARGSSKLVRNAAGISSFLNAALQGQHRAYRSLRRERSLGSAALVGTAMVGPMLGLHAYNSGQEQYDNLTTQQRSSGLWFTWPKDTAEMAAFLSGSQKEFRWQSDGGQILHRSPEAELIPIPIPQEFAAIGAIFNGLIDSIRTGNGDKAVEGFTQGVMGAMPGFHLPDAVEPFVNLRLNRDGLDREITPDALRDAPAQAQVRPNSTPDWAINLGELQEKITRNMLGAGREGVVAFTPIELDYLAKHFLPGVLAPFLAGAGQIGRDEGARGERPAAMQEEFDIRHPTSAFTRGFSRTGEGQAPAVSEVYELGRRVAAAAKAMQSEMTNPRQRSGFEGRDVSQERERMEWLQQHMSAATATLGTFTRQAAEIDADTAMSPAQKRTALNAVNAQRNQTARDFLDPIKKDPEFGALFRTWLNPNPHTNTGERNLIRQPPAFLGGRNADP